MTGTIRLEGFARDDASELEELLTEAGVREDRIEVSGGE